MSHEQEKCWYTVMSDRTDSWDVGAFDYETAVEMANRRILEGKPVYCIAKIDAGYDEQGNATRPGILVEQYIPGEDFKVRIKDARHFVGMTQQQVSEKFEIPLRTIESWETGKRKPPDYVERLVVKAILRSGQH